tara:strand:+ start:2457 stop:2651 length:195 start_codon:yes stop_codon:yes gene_type:complete
MFGIFDGIKTGHIVLVVAEVLQRMNVLKEPVPRSCIEMVTLQCHHIEQEIEDMLGQFDTVPVHP